MAERVPIPGRPTLVGRAPGAAVFATSTGSTWADSTSWPPRLVERADSVISAVRTPAGMWLAYVRRGEQWRMCWYAALDAAIAEREVRDVAPFVGDGDAARRVDGDPAAAPAARLESVHVLGERALVVPRDAGSARYPFLAGERGWRELTALPPFEPASSEARCAAACVRLGDDTDVLVWDGHIFRFDGTADAFAPFGGHQLRLAWYRDHAPVALGAAALLACDDEQLVELDMTGAVPRLRGVAAASVHAGPGETFVVTTTAGPLVWSPREDWVCELSPALIGKRGEVVGATRSGGLVIFDRRERDLSHLAADELARLPRRRASDLVAVAVAAPVAALDELGAAGRPQLAGIGEHLVLCSDHELRFHVGDRAVGIERWAAPIVAVAHDGRHVAALDVGGTLRVRGGIEAGSTGAIDITGAPRSLAVGPDGSWVVVTADGVELVDIRAILQRGESPVRIALSGALAAAVDRDGTALVIAEGRRFATWTAGVLAERPPAAEQLVACAALGGGRFACAGERHLFIYDAHELELELLERVRDHGRSYAGTHTALLAAAPDGRTIAWGASPRMIEIGAIEGALVRVVDHLYFHDEYTQPLDTPLAIRGLAFTSATTVAIALDHGRGTVVDLAARTAQKLGPQIGDEASRWIFFFSGKTLVAE